MTEDDFAELQSAIYDQAIEASADLPISTLEVLLTGIAAELRIIRTMFEDRTDEGEERKC